MANARAIKTRDELIRYGINSTLTTYGIVLMLALAWKKNTMVHSIALCMMFLGVAMYAHSYDLSTMKIVTIVGYVLGIVFLKMQFNIFFDFIEAV